MSFILFVTSAALARLDHKKQYERESHKDKKLSVYGDDSSLYSDEYSDGSSIAFANQSHPLQRASARMSYQSSVSSTV